MHRLSHHSAHTVPPHFSKCKKTQKKIVFFLSDQVCTTTELQSALHVPRPASVARMRHPTGDQEVGVEIDH